jgi:hypothetical protein
MSDARHAPSDLSQKIHDVRNRLQGIVVNAATAQRKANPKEELIAIVALAREASVLLAQIQPPQDPDGLT